MWELIETRAAATPDAALAVDENRRSMTFGEYRDRCLSAAAGLHRHHGIGEDSAVSWLLPTWLESFVLVGALARLSARQNPIIPIYREREVGFAVTQTDADCSSCHRSGEGSTTRRWPTRSRHCTTPRASSSVTMHCPKPTPQ